MATTDYSLDRGLPSNVEAERSLLGAILLDNALYTDAGAALKPDDFFLDSHRRIYSRMLEMADTNRPIDLVTLSEELSRHKELEAIGGVAYLASLTDGTPRRSSRTRPESRSHVPAHTGSRLRPQKRPAPL